VLIPKLNGIGLMMMAPHNKTEGRGIFPDKEISTTLKTD
jgi:hypothetical protein